MPIRAIQHIRPMRGGAQSHLMLGEDGNLYVVKFQNNPQHLRVLANELLATGLAQALHLTVAQCALIEVDDYLIVGNPEMVFQPTGERCQSGLHFGSRFVGGLMPGHVVDYLPEDFLLEVRNLNEFAGMVAFDKWTFNLDSRQAVFSKTRRQHAYAATFIDHGYCFNSGEWSACDHPLRGVYRRNAVYEGVTAWASFEPWLGRIECLPTDVMRGIADTIPSEWYDHDREGLGRLIEQLVGRRAQVRGFIRDFANSSRAPFPFWTDRR